MNFVPMRARGSISAKIAQEVQMPKKHITEESKKEESKDKQPSTK